MINPLIHAPEQAAERVNNVIAEIFNAATIALVGVVGVLTLAATI